MAPFSFALQRYELFFNLASFSGLFYPFFRIIAMRTVGEGRRNRSEVGWKKSFAVFYLTDSKWFKWI